MPDQFKNALIGLFVLAALAIIVFLILFLHPKTGDEAQVLYVRFTDIDKVNVGTRVTFAGRAVGEVAEIQELASERTGAQNDFGHVYSYQLKLLIDSRVKVFDTDQISLRTSGLLGERSVSIIPIAPPPGQTPRLITKGEILYSTEAGSVEDTMREFKEVANKFDIALDNVSHTLEEMRREGLWKEMAATIRNVKEITASLDKPEELAAIVNNIQRLTSALANRIPESWDILDKALENTKDITLTGKDIVKTTKNIVETANKVVVQVSSGDGTLGRILVRDDLYLQLSSILSKVETLADDVNHYGLLFHVDKGWQRLRAQRVNLMQRLSSPQEFRNYFNEEMNQISTSLSRVSMVLQNCDACDMQCDWMDDCQFRKVFAELLRRTTILEDSLKLYNQQLMECEVKKTEL